MKHSTALLVLLITGLLSVTLAQKSRIGDFDINKVREAVGGGLSDSAMGPGGTDAPQDQVDSLGQGYFWITLRIIAILVLLALTIMVGIWLIKKFGLSGTSRVGGGSMDVLEALPIGQNKSIVLVRVLDAVLVLSQTPQQVALLEKIEGNKAVELIASTKGGTSIVQFKDMFNSFMGKMKKTS